MNLTTFGKLKLGDRFFEVEGGHRFIKLQPFSEEEESRRYNCVAIDSTNDTLFTYNFPAFRGDNCVVYLDNFDNNPTRVVKTEKEPKSE
jgi:hypothetical protein